MPGSSSPMRRPRPEEHNASASDASRATTPRLRKKATNWKVISHMRSRRSGWISNEIMTTICQKIQKQIGFQPKPWQVSVMADVIHFKKDAIVSAGTGLGKSLPYHLIPLIRPSAIVLVISPTIALMNDQVGCTIELVYLAQLIFQSL